MKNRHPADKYVEIGLALALLLWSFGALGQSVNSDQIKKKTDGGLVGDAAKALAVGIVRASSSPSSPVTGQLWCDTTLSPCTLKQYTGSTWVAPQVNAAITTQADVSSFPGSPVDGQIFFSKSERALWVYDSTATAWRSIGMSWTQSGANITDTYSNAVITPPGAMTVTASATVGSMAAGTYSYKLTCRNATGGETTGGTVSANVTVTLNKSVDFSSIPTCGTGGVTRNIYRTKVNQNATGPWYFEKAIADNTTTTGVNSGLADASITLLSPDINFSAALPGSWTATIPGGGAAGGCGGTGATRATMVCWGGTAGGVRTWNTTTDSTMNRGQLDISSYSAGNYTIQYRIKQLSQNGDTYLNVVSPCYMGARVGTADNSIRFNLSVGGGDGVSSAQTLPFSGAQHSVIVLDNRLSVAGTSADVFVNNVYPEIDAMPFWARLVRKAGTLNAYLSSDGMNWSPIITGSNNSNYNAILSMNVALAGSSLNRFEIPVCTNSNAVQVNSWIEIDSFTLTVNP